MKTAVWTAVTLVSLTALSACNGGAPRSAVTASSKDAIQAALEASIAADGEIPCEGEAIHVFPGTDRCSKKQGYDPADSVSFDKYRVIGAHDTVIYDVSLYDAIKAGTFKLANISGTITMEAAHLGSAENPYRRSISGMSETAELGDIAYITYFIGPSSCVGFIRRGAHRDEGYAGFYTGQICQDGIDHALTPDDVARLVGLVKGKD